MDDRECKAAYSCDSGTPTAAQGQNTVEAVLVESLVAGDKVRLKGVDKDHVRLLAESEGPLPPILVHRRTMRVIDGMHRLSAARVQGRRTIDVRFFEGDEEAMFIEAVQANISHGLPLTLADRRAAASRIVRTHAKWSDRMIAGMVGLSPKTVGAVRARLTEEFPQSRLRVGKDGRTRRLPVRDAEREISSTSDAGGTKTDAASGVTDDPHRAPQLVPRPLGPGRVTRLDIARDQGSGADRYRTMFHTLRQDPSMRMTETGRFLLRLLNLHLVQAPAWNQLLANVPPHRLESVVDLAEECARMWLELAERLATHNARKARSEKYSG